MLLKINTLDYSDFIITYPMIKFSGE